MPEVSSPSEEIPQKTEATIDSISENSELRENTHFKDSWFHAYLKGNMLWPQTFTPGIVDLTIESLLRDPPDQWGDFLNPQLSEKQLGIFGVALNNMHLNMGIDLKFKDERSNSDTRTISLEGAHGLLMNATSNVSRVLAEEINNSKNGLVSNYLPSRQDTIIDFFSHTENAQDIEKIKEKYTRRKELLLSPDGLELAELYRLIISKQYHKSKGGKFSGELKEKMDELTYKYSPSLNFKGEINNHSLLNFMDHALHSDEESHSGLNIQARIPDNTTQANNITMIKIKEILQHLKRDRK